MKNKTNDAIKQAVNTLALNSDTPLKTAFKITIGFYLAQLVVTFFVIIGFIVVVFLAKWFLL